MPVHEFLQSISGFDNTLLMQMFHDINHAVLDL